MTPENDEEGPSSRRERADLAKAAKSFAAGQWDVPVPVTKIVRQPQKAYSWKSLEVCVCPNVECPMMLLNAAGSRTRKVLFQTSSV